MYKGETRLRWISSDFEALFISKEYISGILM